METCGILAKWASREQGQTVTFCTYLMRQESHPLGQFPTGCIPFDKEVYGPIMKPARQVG